MTASPMAAQGGAPSRSIPVLTLSDVLQRAQRFSPQFQMAVTSLGVANQAQVQSRAALLPSVNFSTQYLYTQGNGTPSGRFIANNAVHEYLSQGNIHEDLYSAALVGQYHLAHLQTLLANAELRIAHRGLRVTVMQGYYGLLAAQHNVKTARNSLKEAQDFLRISQELEKGGEVAHSDVLKAALQVSQRQSALADAQLAEQQTRMALGVLLFPQPDQPFRLQDALGQMHVLPPYAQVQQMAGVRNPLLEAAQTSLAAAKQNVSIARGGYLPTLSLDYWYGIDATRFATRTDGVPNLGSAAAVTLNIPVWNWGATRSRVRQARLQQHQAQVELNFTQSQLIANLHALYGEAATARRQLNLLRHSLDLAQQGLRLSVLRYRHGETTVLEVVTAQDALTQARYAWTNGEVRYHMALANLQTLTGAF